jgi:Flp pilus assembly pilin Flp
VKLVRFIGNFHQDEAAQDLLEYALVLAAVLVAVVAGSSNLATLLSSSLDAVSTRIQSTIA